ncbi:flavin reductase family protein [Streptacidiphilus sp. EB129]|uniref:flavin reductase family protein n=1 Tax=Streptacidiphilus sp. EB129 TaxID=3156262 RepID=UPI0035173B84
MTTPIDLARTGTSLWLDRQDQHEEQGEQVEPAVFRAVMGSLAAGVSIVTCLDEDAAPRGLTCTAVCSVSAAPPLLLVCIQQNSSTLDAIHHSGAFAVNLLAGGTEKLAMTFARNVPERFAQVDWAPGERTGAPVLARTAAWAECLLTHSRRMGDHQLVVGRVVRGGSRPEQLPLVYWRSQFAEVLP